MQPDAGRARDELDGPVVVRRPEPAADDAEVGAQPFRQRRLELALVVADDREPRRLEPEPDELAGEERPVAVVPVAADQLRAGDDEDATQTGRRAP